MNAETSGKRKAVGDCRAAMTRREEEAAVWEGIGANWRRIYGSFDVHGASVESHDFEFPGVFDWGGSFHRRSLEVCLNLSGTGVASSELDEVRFEPNTIGFYCTGDQDLQARREPGQQHRFITVEFSAGYLRERLSACDGALHTVVEEFVRRPDCAAVGATHRLTTDQERVARQLTQPPVVMAARELWYESKILELIASLFFERAGEDEMFCDRQKRVARERVDRVAALLRSRLIEPPTLDEIGRAVGCSPFHLSRTFSQEMGITIPQYLRKIRIERAAELLRSGKYNVTEAATEVGYSSLSHFSQAFCQLMGCCPALYPSKGNARR